ncbi:hypothetical protein KZ829_23575 [Actinoplanes hulinensis]|uniref:Uncharacterized protein n=1 Tax=Actinoplanes hulinensis TaxID=1144547 RepID=A0ABS7B6P5_9ACTN|nr:hypothetical protein [Actinoplanes hulinensis]MBW6436726.1 hypothetical protein [Actinoplanes hulinensis]
MPATVFATPAPLVPGVFPTPGILATTALPPPAFFVARVLAVPVFSAPDASAALFAPGVFPAAAAGRATGVVIVARAVTARADTVLLAATAPFAARAEPAATADRGACVDRVVPVAVRLPVPDGGLGFEAFLAAGIEVFLLAE